MRAVLSTGFLDGVWSWRWPDAGPVVAVWAAPNGGAWFDGAVLAVWIRPMEGYDEFWLWCLAGEVAGLVQARWWRPRWRADFWSGGGRVELPYGGPRGNCLMWWAWRSLM